MNKGFIMKPIPTPETCSGCKYHKSRLLRSGKSPIYKNICENPDLDEHHQYNDEVFGNIGKYDTTPIWCPLKKQIKSNPTINKFK